MPPPRLIAIHNGHPRLRYDRHAIERALRTLDDAAPTLALPRGGVPPGTLSIAFLTDGALAEIHGRFLGDPTTTDVITFEGSADPAEPAAGEICVSADTARTFARRTGGDFSIELTLYLIHGWLHLAGHDDLKPALKRRMRAAEKRCLELLKERRAIPSFRLASNRGFHSAHKSG